MPKRETKAEREARQYNELRQRVSDICTGACGYDVDTPDEFMTAEALSRAVPALELRFSDWIERDGKHLDRRAHLWRCHNLDHFGGVDTITGFLWDQGVRATDG